ncbi:MAG: SRPBCC family protein [Candidatus Rokubacteria bacterium]|nr:SRPBCC family protein [Candidatus Rokubacteria bacterium]
MLHHALAALALVAVMATGAGASSADTDAMLDADVRHRVERGETVIERRAVPGFPWPEIIAYRRTAATPAEVMALYADVARQREWVPDLVVSRVLRREAPDVFRVFYEYEIAGPNERYTVTLTVTRESGGWVARWALLTARYARRLEGALRVTPLGDGALIAYTSRVDPGSLGATFGTPESVARNLARTTDALASRVEALRRTAPDRLRMLVEHLRAMTTSGVAG